MEKIEIMRDMLANNPENGLAWYLLGVEYVETGNESDALYAFSQALNYCGQEFKTQIFEQLARLTDKKDILSIDRSRDENKTVSPALEERNEKGEAEKEFADKEEYEDNSADFSEEFEDWDEEQEDNFDVRDDNIIRLSVVEGGKSNKGSSFVSEKRSPVTFDKVGGYDELKDIIRMKIIKPFSSQGLFSRYKKKSGGGILLFGPPGCGKTYIAKATAGECQAGFLAVHITDILDPYLGVSSQNVKDIFAKARTMRPCVLFFDEIDTIGFNRSKLASEHMRPIIDQLLTEIEGIDSDTQDMLIIGATNMPWDVDPAFKRPGRFDKVIFVPPPDKKARIAILELKMSDRPQEKKIDYDSIAEKTELYSGADLENVVETATENVLAEILKTGIERPIDTKDLLKAVASTRPSTIEWLKTIRNFVKYSNQTGLYDEVEKYLSKKSRYL
ncbi:AAA family ATPase [Anaerocolumna sp. AGMB13020]|uniref:AAA family ATPase n=1 Tax=Anaerocolumna sp. AGMB13020 TaxID=3081750 RepID=UPI0029544D99|nr:AAA family ATPase [Anaerocolumna sp. AGMB13020]WOO37675.1 AAA family ATPase [Anaerocolumna sp. AGMB13020]